MKIEEIVEKIKNMKPIEKLDFLLKLYNEVEDKEKLEELIKNTREELSSERTPVNIHLEFKNISENKSEIEKKIEKARENEKKEENAEYTVEYVKVKFIPKEDVAFWTEGNAPSKKYYKPIKSEEYEVVW